MSGARKGICLLLAALCAAAGWSCTSTSLTATNPSLTKCGVALSAPDTLVVASGGAVTIDVATAPECAWSVSKDANWIASVSPASGQGTGRINVQVMANPDATARQTEVDINGQRASVRQEAAACQFSISPQAVALAAGAGSSAFTVTASASCSWTAVSSVPWLAVTAGAAGTGTGEVTVNAQANTGASRVGTITIGGQTITVAQSAAASGGGSCTYAIDPNSHNAPGTGGTGTPIAVSTATGCAWTSTSNASWITIASGVNGSGNGSVTFTVAANNGPARTGTLTVAGKTFTVTQAANCVYGVVPLTQTVSSDAGPGEPISVTAVTGCTWTARSNDGWVTITSGTNGNGDGTVAFKVTKHNGTRIGTLTVAGQTVTVTQDK